MTTSPVGYIFSGDPAPGVQRFNIAGCASASPNAEGIYLSLDNASTPGTYSGGSTSFTDAGGIMWGVVGDPLEVTLTTFQQVGGAVDGSFKATVTHGGNAAHFVSGSFHVCRVQDELAP